MKTKPASERFAQLLDRMFPNWCHFAIINWRGRRSIPVVNTTDGDQKITTAIVPASLLQHPGVRGQRWVMLENPNHRPNLIDGRTMIAWTDTGKIARVVQNDGDRVTVEIVLQEWDSLEVFPEGREVHQENLEISDLLRSMNFRHPDALVKVSYLPLHGD